MASVNPEFGIRLRALRIGRGNECLSQRALAEAAQVRVSHVSDVERGQRPCGPEVAARIAAALGVQGDALVDFMRLAATTTERGHLWVKSPDFEQLVIAIANKLRRQGVDERGIVSVSTAPSASSAESADILVVMADGTRIYVGIRTRFERGVHR